MDYASAEWKDCVAWASREAERLGIELSLHNSPGYSACGGPWIAPEESMKELTWSIEKDVVRQDLQDLQDCDGRTSMINPVNPVNPVKRNFYREIARYPLTTADETIDIDKRLEKGESVEFALDCEKEVSALNVWRGEREKPLDPFDGPRDYGCTLKVEAFDGAAWRAVGDVRCPTLRARDVSGFLRLKSPARATRLRLTSNRGKKRGAHSFQFLVANTGEPIPEEKREDVFKPFLEIKDLTEGDGLGLPICKQMALKMKGDLEIDPKFTKGTRFILDLHS